MLAAYGHALALFDEVLPVDGELRAECGLRLRFESTGGIPLDKIAIDSLAIYLDGSEDIPGELYRQLIGETVAVYARPANAVSARPIVHDPPGGPCPPTRRESRPS